MLSLLPPLDSNGVDAPPLIAAGPVGTMTVGAEVGAVVLEVREAGAGRSRSPAGATGGIGAVRSEEMLVRLKRGPVGNATGAGTVEEAV